MKGKEVMFERLSGFFCVTLAALGIVLGSVFNANAARYDEGSNQGQSQNQNIKNYKTLSKQQSSSSKQSSNQSSKQGQTKTQTTSGPAKGGQEIYTRKVTTRYVTTAKTQEARYEKECQATLTCHYVGAGISSPFKTQVSGGFISGIEKDGFVMPFADRKWGAELMFGTIFNRFSYLSMELGATYDVAYVRKDKFHDEYGLHAIMPATVRVLFDAMPESRFGVYMGGEMGAGMVNFIHISKRESKFAMKYGALAGVSYKFGDEKNTQMYLGYRYFYVPKGNYRPEEGGKEFETFLESHGIHLGFRYLFS